MGSRHEGFSDAEHEAIDLCIAVEAIDDTVNPGLIDLLSVEGGEAAEVYFKSDVHQHLFLVRLLDFTWESSSRKRTGGRGSYLDVLQAVCESNQLGQADHAAALAQAVAAARTWLSADTKLKLWLPTLDLEAHLTVARSELLFVVGNHLKHNLSRLTGVSKRLAKLLEVNGYTVDVEGIPLALDDFREHLTEDYFIYYGTWLAALVNDLRWAIQQYLLPVFERAHVKDDDGPRYRYEYPTAIKGGLPRKWFWRLMNHVRSGPLLPKFAVPANLHWEHLHSPRSEADR